MRKLNTRFVVLGVILALPVAIALTLIIRLRPMVGQPPDPTPLPPTILVPRGELPAGPVGLREWARYQGENYHLVGSGFLLQLADGQIVGVTTAHSVTIGDANRRLEQMGLSATEQPDFVIEFDTFHGQPGRARTEGDMAVDYVLLHTEQAIEAGLVLSPDRRGKPQPGERVSLFTDIGSTGSGPRILEGTVQSVDDRAVWVLMDKLFNPALMSGSPLISQHTGQVVGMLIAGTPRGYRLLLGMHPIGSIVDVAESAAEFPRLSEYQR